MFMSVCCVVRVCVLMFMFAYANFQKGENRNYDKNVNENTVQLSTWMVAMSRTCRAVLYSYFVVPCCDHMDHIGK